MCRTDWNLRHYFVKILLDICGLRPLSFHGKEQLGQFLKCLLLCFTEDKHILDLTATLMPSSSSSLLSSVSHPQGSDAHQWVCGLKTSSTHLFHILCRSVPIFTLFLPPFFGARTPHCCWPTQAKSVILVNKSITASQWLRCAHQRHIIALCRIVVIMTPLIMVIMG